LWGQDSRYGMSPLFIKDKGEQVRGVTIDLKFTVFIGSSVSIFVKIVFADCVPLDGRTGNRLIRFLGEHGFPLKRFPA